MPLRLKLQKNSPERDAPDEHFLFDGELGETHEEEPEAVGVSTYNAEEAYAHLWARIKEASVPLPTPPSFW